jgi:hypothetical protein
MDNLVHLLALDRLRISKRPQPVRVQLVHPKAQRGSTAHPLRVAKPPALFSLWTVGWMGVQISKNGILNHRFDMVQNRQRLVGKAHGTMFLNQAVDKHASHKV